MLKRYSHATPEIGLPFPQLIRKEVISKFAVFEKKYIYGSWFFEFCIHDVSVAFLVFGLKSRNISLRESANL